MLLHSMALQPFTLQIDKINYSEGAPSVTGIYAGFFSLVHFLFAAV